METLTHSSPLDTMSSSDSAQYLKMEDFHTATASTSPAPTASDAPYSQSSPAPVVVHSRPAKKRKSWGQQLPEPKTTLPPRKRAKTDDEKEQRRIERIKRNRAAAHNSRERKRQESEYLAVALAKANAELEAYRKLHGPLPANIVLPEVHLCTDSMDVVTTPAPSLVESHGSHGDAPSPASPADDIFQQPSIKQEPFEASFPTSLPPAFDNSGEKSFVLLPLDLTQHSAAMLCDLPCRSSRKSNTTPSPASWWASLILSLVTIQIQTCYRTLLVALWTLSPSRMARLMQASALRSTSRLTTSSTTQLLLRSTRRRLARHNAATGLSAPQKGARALQRQSLNEVQKARLELTAKQAQTHQTQMAFTDHGVSDDLAKGDEGDENHGVGRGI